MTAVQWLLDGVDLETHGAITAVQSDLDLVGGDDAIPYRPGVVFRRRTPGAGDLQLGMVIADGDGSGDAGGITQWLANWRAFRAFVWRPEAQRTLTRRITLPDTTVEEAAAAATLVQLPQAGMAGAAACTTVLDLRLLDGYLYGTSTVTVTSPGTVTVEGDAHTSRMTITMAAGTLTNTTTGATLTYTGPGTATIDVANWTATSGGSNVAGDISWPAAGHDFWFDLATGANMLTGTATIAYKPAYLPTA